MKKVFKKMLCLLSALALLFTADNYVLIANAEATTRVKEIRGQIDFNNINMGVLNNEEITYSAKTEKGRISSTGETEVRELDKLISVAPDVKDYILDNINNNVNLYAIGYTTLYLTENDEGELVPIEEQVSKNSSLFSTRVYATTGESSPKFTCTSLTLVGVMAGTNNNNTYAATSYVSWSQPNYIGGEKYHGSGTDYLLQACPETFTIKKDYTYVGYYQTENYGKTWDFQYDSDFAWLGDLYWKENGGNSYIRYAVEDEYAFNPLIGYCWALKNIQLNTHSTVQASSSTRKINSYYIHSWDDITINVMVAASSSNEVSLEITPSIASKSWQLYSYVTFNY